MLRQASNLCRAVLLSPDHQIAAAANTSNIQINWAACSVLKAFTANIQGIAVVQQQQQQRQAATAAEARTAPGDDGSSSSSGIVIHDSAVQRLKELQAEAGPDRAVKLRVEVEGGGCSGFQYKFRLDDSVTADDIVFEREGVQVVCDTVSMDFLSGAVIEFEDSLMRSAFQIASNPNSESTCGCGTSFVAKI